MMIISIKNLKQHIPDIKIGVPYERGESAESTRSAQQQVGEGK